jgi:hypothetical protein
MGWSTWRNTNGDAVKAPWREQGLGPRRGPLFPTPSFAKLRHVSLELIA